MLILYVLCTILIFFIIEYCILPLKTLVLIEIITFFKIKILKFFMQDLYINAIYIKNNIKGIINLSEKAARDILSISSILSK